MLSRLESRHMENTGSSSTTCKLQLEVCDTIALSTYQRLSTWLSFSLHAEANIMSVPTHGHPEFEGDTDGPPLNNHGVPTFEGSDSGFKLEDFVWTKVTSLKGNEYEVGTPKAKESSFADDLASVVSTSNLKDGGILRPAHGEREEFNISVNWPVGTKDWKTTSTTVYDVAGISKYALYENDGWLNVFKYILYFKNNVNYEFMFRDEENDEYQVSTLVHGEHYVKYNSKKPNIVHIKSKNSKAKELFG
ncbi:hypothetical protein H0H93_012844 [Arthromyces matolae]|nr:hypothetical protein H0H93_012844 [Arthromyces matolae]